MRAYKTQKEEIVDNNQNIFLLKKGAYWFSLEVFYWNKKELAGYAEFCYSTVLYCSYWKSLKLFGGYLFSVLLCSIFSAVVKLCMNSLDPIYYVHDGALSSNSLVPPNCEENLLNLLILCTAMLTLVQSFTKFFLSSSIFSALCYLPSANLFPFLMTYYSDSVVTAGEVRRTVPLNLARETGVPWWRIFRTRSIYCHCGVQFAKLRSEISLWFFFLFLAEMCAANTCRNMSTLLTW
jgi:hypothetical protein